MAKTIQKIGPDFGQFCPKFAPQIFVCVDFTSTRCWTWLQAIIVCNFKEHYLGKHEILAHFAQIQAPQFFFQKSDFYQLSSCTISEKTNDPILRKLSDRRTDRWTDRRTDVQD